MANTPNTKDSEQVILNSSFDPETGTLVFTPVGYDGVSAVKQPPAAVATKITESGDYTYIAIASVGTAQATAKWQVKRIDESTPGTTVITWADGDSDFDNVATDLTTLSYS